MNYAKLSLMSGVHRKPLKWVALFLLALPLCASQSCGTKDAEEIAIVLQSNGGTNLFNNSELADIVFIVTEVTADNNGTQVAFPSACAAATPPPANCGFDPDSAEFRLDPSPIPKETSITLQVIGRDGDGVNLFTGVSASFKNNPTAGPVTVTVSAVP